MNTKPIIKIHNVQTDEIIEREMNDEEFAEWEKARQSYEEELRKEKEKIEARAALLNRLGITEEEAKLLLS